MTLRSLQHVFTSACTVAAATVGLAGDYTQLGRSPHRNNAVESSSVPAHWDVETGENWKASRTKTQTVIDKH